LRKKGISLVLSLVMVFSNLPAAFAAKIETASVAHWASPVLASWEERGLIHGYPDGSLRPDEALNRAEATSLVNKLFGFTAKASESYSDVKDGAWYADAIAAAKAAGYISGYPDGSFKPEAKVNREQFAVMLAGVFRLPPSGDSALAGIGDAGKVSGYAREALGGLIDGGYVSGYADGTVRPQKVITRAEAVTLLDRLAGGILNKKGDTAAHIKSSGNVVVSAPDVTLTGANIAGDLYVTAGVGEGDLTLEHSTVKGRVYVDGGGQFSVHLKDSKLGGVVISKKSPVRVVLSEGSEAGQVEILTPGNRLEIGRDTTVRSLHITSGASQTKIQAEGTIQQVSNEASSVTLNDKDLPKESSVQVDQGAVKPAAPAGIEPANRCANEPADCCADEPADRCADKPADRCANEPADRCANKPANCCTDEPANRCADEPANRCANEPADRCADEPANRCANKSANGYPNESADRSAWSAGTGTDVRYDV
jgi:hypothetical protein